jgi:hypothetical protein
MDYLSMERSMGGIANVVHDASVTAYLAQKLLRKSMYSNRKISIEINYMCSVSWIIIYESLSRLKVLIPEFLYSIVELQIVIDLAPVMVVLNGNIEISGIDE